MSRSTLHRKVKAGLIPPPIKDGEYVALWNRQWARDYIARLENSNEGDQAA